MIATLSIAFQLLIGVIAYAALFLSSFGIPEKIFFGAVLLMWTMWADGFVAFFDDKVDYARGVILASLEAIETQIHDRGKPSVADAIVEVVKSREFRYRLAGSGINELLFLATKYALWICGGWVTATYLVPQLSGSNWRSMF